MSGGFIEVFDTSSSCSHLDPDECRCAPDVVIFAPTGEVKKR